jgi:hypothetical protein
MSMIQVVPQLAQCACMLPDINEAQGFCQTSSSSSSVRIHLQCSSHKHAWPCINYALQLRQRHHDIQFRYSSVIRCISTDVTGSDTPSKPHTASAHHNFSVTSMRIDSSTQCKQTCAASAKQPDTSHAQQP